MKVTYRIPSRKVQYGYLEFNAEPGNLPDPAELAEEYAQYILDYQAAEVMAFENPAARQLKKADQGDINVAAQTIKDGLGATEMSPEEAAKPWNKTDETPTKSKPAASADWDF